MKDAEDHDRTEAVAIDGVLSANSVENKTVFAERESFFDCADKRRQFDLTIHDRPESDSPGARMKSPRTFTAGMSSRPSPR